MELKFVVPGKVQAKQSAKFVNYGNFIKAYQPAIVVNYANWVKQCFMAAYPDHKADAFKGSMLAIKIVAFFEIPKSKSLKFQAAAQTGYLRPTVKPDTDNIAKNIKDALNKLAFPDDSQIVEEIIEKRYSDNPRAEIYIKDLSMQIMQK